MYFFISLYVFIIIHTYKHTHNLLTFYERKKKKEEERKRERGKFFYYLHSTFTLHYIVLCEPSILSLI